MKWLRLLAAAGLLASTCSVAAGPAPGRRISIQFRGPLKDALKRIASEGGINLVVTGDLDQSAEVYLKDVSPEDALRSVANAYHLKIIQDGNIWTLRPLEKTETGAPLPPLPPASPEPPVEPTDKEARATEDKTEGSSEVEPPTALHGKAARDKIKDIRKKLQRRRVGRGSDDKIVGGNLVIAEGESAGNAVVYGGTLTVNGDLSGDAVAFGGNLEINGRVAGDAVVLGGGLHLTSKAAVGGDVVAVGGVITKDEGAEIGGSQTTVGIDGVAPSIGSIDQMVRGILGKRLTLDKKKFLPFRDEEETPTQHNRLLHFLIYFGLLFGMGFLLFIFAPNRMKHVEDELRNDPLRCGLTGVVGLVALVPLTVLLVITVIGILFAAVLLVGSAVGVMMGVCALAHEIGMRLPWFKLRRTQAGVLAVGILILMLVGQVPILGPITMLLIIMLAFGAIIRTRFGQKPRTLGEPVAALPL